MQTELFVNDKSNIVNYMVTTKEQFETTHKIICIISVVYMRQKINICIHNNRLVLHNYNLSLYPLSKFAYL